MAGKMTKVKLDIYFGEKAGPQCVIELFGKYC